MNFGAPVGTMVSPGKVVEAGYANECSAAQLAAAINANTAAILYISPTHRAQKSILSVAEAAGGAWSTGSPLIVDAAAGGRPAPLLQPGSGSVILRRGAKGHRGAPPAARCSANASMCGVKQQGNGIGRAMKVRRGDPA